MQAEKGTVLSTRPELVCPVEMMKSAVLLAFLALLFSSAEATSGTFGFVIGPVAGIIVCLAMVISIGLGLIFCMYRNQLCSCCSPGIQQV